MVAGHVLGPGGRPGSRRDAALRYEMAATRLFHSAWSKLERLRKDCGEPLFPRGQCGLAAGAVARPAPPAEPVSEPVPPARATDAGTGTVAPQARGHVAGMARRSIPGARLVDGRHAPDRYQPRLSVPEQDEPDAQPAREWRTSRQAEKPLVAIPEAD